MGRFHVEKNQFLSQFLTVFLFQSVQLRTTQLILSINDLAWPPITTINGLAYPVKNDVSKRAVRWLLFEQMPCIKNPHDIKLNNIEQKDKL
jgi:hypothetical protein